MKAFYDKANAWFREWQNDFFDARNIEPTSKDIIEDNNAVVVHNKIVITEKILRKWNISFISN